MKLLKSISKFALIAFTFIILYTPIVIITILSFNDSQRSYEWKGFTFKWYAEIFANESLFSAIVNTILVALVATFIATILGTLIAISIDKATRKNKKKVMFLNNIPIVNPDIVTGISLMMVFSLFGLPFGPLTMLLSHIFFTIPFVILSVLPKLKRLDANLYDAAIDLGCSHYQALTKVIIPSIKPGIITGALIAFTMSIDDFVISYFNTGHGFANFSMWIYSRLGRKTFSPAAYAYSTLLITITITVVVGYFLYTLKKEKKEKR